jgi:hypothetical protein
MNIELNEESSLKRIDAVRNNVVWEQTAQHMPAPEELALMAGSVPDAPRYLCASDYGESAEALRRKGYTWKEVQGWLSKHGADFSIQALISGWRTWGRNHSA